jgi:hypothetical protein
VTTPLEPALVVAVACATLLFVVIEVAGVPAPTSPRSLVVSFSEGSEFSGTCDPYTVTVQLTAHVSGGVPPFRFSWLFGAGISSQAGEFVNHTYDGNGRFNAHSGHFL